MFQPMQIEVNPRISGLTHFCARVGLVCGESFSFTELNKLSIRARRR